MLRVNNPLPPILIKFKLRGKQGCFIMLIYRSVAIQIGNVGTKQFISTQFHFIVCITNSKALVLLTCNIILTSR